MIENRDGAFKLRSVQDKLSIQEYENALYMRLLNCADRLPRQTRTTMDKWWVEVINQRMRKEQ